MEVSGLKGSQQQEVGETPDALNRVPRKAGLGLLGLGAGFAQLEPLLEGASSKPHVRSALI